MLSETKVSSNPSSDLQNNFNNIIKVYLENLDVLPSDESLEFEVRFGTRNVKTITKINFDNVIQMLLNYGFEIADNDEYSLRIQNEYIEKTTHHNKISNLRTEINGLTNIQDYCRNNQLPENPNPASVKFTQKKYFNRGSKVFYPVNFDDFNFRASLQTEKNVPISSDIIESLIRTWSDNKKTFRYLKRSSLIHKELPFRVDLSIVKESQRNGTQYITEYTVKDSNVFNSLERYEIEIEIDNQRVGVETEFNNYKDVVLQLRRVIKYILCGLQETNYPISLTEQNMVLDHYMRLIKEKDYKEKMVAFTRDFMGPSSYTLQIQNIVSLDSALDIDSNVPNIRDKYTVTDKADGIRKLMYINPEGKIYLINTNMQVQFTGAVTPNDDAKNTLIDGEHILHNKKKEFINLFAAFDIYFLKGVNVTSLAFTRMDSKEIATNFRWNIFASVIKKLRETSIIKGEKSPMRFEYKKFYSESSEQSIFNGCATILQNEKDGLFEYETDGLIFTPMNKGVGSDTVGEFAPNQKNTWKYSFKWKPAEYNTIDFLVTTQKTASGKNVVNNIFANGLNVVNESQLTQYQTVVLRVGFDEKKHGYINPCDNIINDTLPTTGNLDQNDSYKPVQFYPTNPSDPEAGIANILLSHDKTGSLKMFSEEEDIVDDNTIVEFRYDINKEKGWNWIPLRVRYDKTAEYRAGLKNFGNAYHVANSNWYSIHNPITRLMISTGENIPESVGDDDIYYNKITKATKTRALRDFHNLYVKSILINNVSKRGDTLIDYSVGKGGDLPKWIHAKLSFVLGIDIARDNIENRLDGACARYLNYKRKFNIMPNALFIQGNSSVNIKSGEALYTERGKQNIRAIFGEGPKDEKFLGKGVYKVYGIVKEGFQISSIQFAIHYMFENRLTLHNLLRNISECTKIGGYFIGTSYDGKTLFTELNSKNKGESISIFNNNDKIWEVKKQYENEDYVDDATCLGYAIDVYQESINKTFREFLVNYNYLTRIMENYGFILLTTEEAHKMNLPASIGMFNSLFINMEQDIKRNKSHKNNYGNSLNMNANERKISFLNKYFIYKKIRVVDADKVANNFINGLENITYGLENITYEDNAITNLTKNLNAETEVDTDIEIAAEAETTKKAETTKTLLSKPSKIKLKIVDN